MPHSKRRTILPVEWFPARRSFSLSVSIRMYLSYIKDAKQREVCLVFESFYINIACRRALNWSCSFPARSISEFIPHRKLRGPRSDCRIYRPSQPRSEKRMNRDAEMRSIEEIENFGAKFQLVAFGETE